jgi:hypothetical protein
MGNRNPRFILFPHTLLTFFYARSTCDRRPADEDSGYLADSETFQPRVTTRPAPSPPLSMADITQKFPPEILTEILSHVPVRDVLKFEQVRRNPLQHLYAGGRVECSRYFQVNRVFRDAVRASPLIKHKIELFAAGLEYNAAAGINLPESREAFRERASNLGLLFAIEETVVPLEVQLDFVNISKTAGGVHAVYTGSGPVRLFSLGSASRGIPCKQWQIPSPVENCVGHCIYPPADLIAFVELQGGRCVDGHRNRCHELIPV